MFKKKLEEKRNKLIARRDDVEAKLVGEADAETRAALGETLKALRDDINEIEEMIASVDAPAEGASTNEGGEGRAFNPVAFMDMRGGKATDDKLEARKAFKNFIATGKKPEKRGSDAEGNNTTDAATAIPENLVNEIMETIEHVGTIYNLVNKTSYPVGQTIPREALKPVATWVGRNDDSLASSTSGEGGTSTVQKGVNLTTSISFTNFKLRCEVAMTEEVAVMTLAAFERLFVKNVSAAMIRAIEYSIVDGDGYGMPTGILASAVRDGQAIEIGADESISYETLCEVEAAIPAEKEGSAKWVMTKKTFMKIVAMTDAVGQPIARVNYGIDGKPERTILGRDVVIYVPQANSKLGNLEMTVTDDTIVAAVFDFNDYTLNCNYNLGISHKLDWDNEDHRTKAVAAYDGKVIDNASLVTLTKKA